MTDTPSPAKSLLTLIDDAAIIMDRDGRLIESNAPARTLLARRSADTVQQEQLTEQFKTFAKDFHRAWSSDSPIPCAVALPVANDEMQTFQGSLRRVPEDLHPDALLLTLQTRGMERLAELHRTIHELDAEVSHGKALQDEVEKQLDRIRTLMMEMHHRVRNNMQVQISLMLQEATRSNNPGVNEVIDVTLNRLWVMSHSLGLMYREDQFHAVEASEFIPSLVEQIAQGLPGKPEIKVSLETDWDIQNDHLNACGFLINELLAGPHIDRTDMNIPPPTLRLFRLDGAICIDVQQDNMDRFAAQSDETAPTHRFIEGLCRQIGAILEFPETTAPTARIRITGHKT